jgi:noranthrone monooxygenase
MMSLLLLTIPVILDTAPSATLLLDQWDIIFHRGHIQGPAISIATGTMHAAAAWRSGEPALAVAAAFTVAMIPYTWIFMRGVNTALFAASASTHEAKETQRDRVKTLVARWSRFNAVRALFPLAGAVVGLVTLVGKASARP